MLTYIEPQRALLAACAPNAVAGFQHFSTTESTMHIYTATVVWKRVADAPFKDNKFSRAHEWRFDGGTVVPASSSPLSVRVPLSNPAAVDPEEALVAAVSSCHMLFFL